MVVLPSRTLARLCALLLLVPAARGAGAQETDFAPLRPDGNGAAALSRVVRVEIDRRPLGAMLDSLAQDAGLGITYGPGLPELAHLVSLRAARLRLAEVLLGLLDGDPLSFLSVQPNWTPELVEDGEFTMADLIRFADPAAAEVHDGLTHEQGQNGGQG